jgi:hypothetical protein
LLDRHRKRAGAGWRERQRPGDTSEERKGVGAATVGGAGISQPAIRTTPMSAPPSSRIRSRQQPVCTRGRTGRQPFRSNLGLSEATTAPEELPEMRLRIGSTIAVVAAVIGLAGSVAGPIYSAFGV